MKDNEMVMKKPLEVYQAVIAGFLLLLTVGTIIVQLMNKITNQQDMINFLVENRAEQHQVNIEMNGNLKEVNNKLTQILVELQNKQDKTK